MGRPLNKRYFGSGAGNQIKVRAKIGANAEGDGVIVSQRGSKKFKVTVGANTGDCFLVDKADGALGANEMSITVLTDAGQLVRATKISAHRVTTGAGIVFHGISVIAQATMQFKWKKLRMGLQIQSPLLLFNQVA